MRIASGYGFVFVVSLGVLFFAGEKQADGIVHHIIGSLIFKAGMAAPFVLLLLVKLLIIFGLKAKAFLILPKLLGIHTAPTAPSSYPSSKNDDDDDVNFDFNKRAKRHVDLIESMVGEIALDEDTLLESVMSVDTMRCAERLMCEIAEEQAEKNDLDEEGLELIDLFSHNTKPSRHSSATAREVYRDAMKTGYNRSNCAKKYPSCPYGKDAMLQLVHTIINMEIFDDEPSPKPTRPQKRKNRYDF